MDPTLEITFACRKFCIACWCALVTCSTAPPAVRGCSSALGDASGINAELTMRIHSYGQRVTHFHRGADGRAEDAAPSSLSNRQRFWYGWKMWSFACTATWHACPQSERLGSAVNLSDAAS